jgi:hypothetical protein
MPCCSYNKARYSHQTGSIHRETSYHRLSVELSTIRRELCYFIATTWHTLSMERYETARWLKADGLGFAMPKPYCELLWSGLE